MISRLVHHCRAGAVCLGVGLVMTGAGAQAQVDTKAQVDSKTQAPAGEGRFTMQPVEGGILKLDTRSGAMSFCHARGVPAAATDWVCEAVPEDRAALEAEIARLQARIATLEKPGVPDIMAPPVPVPGTPPDATPPIPPQAGKPETPEEERTRLRAAMDQAMDMADYAFRRFKEMVDRLREEPPRGEQL
ncbi:hypothetical protein MKI84_07655 [Ancylobacter sp. A5.8]|uniref:hypothetical protein n=1 Tax=Ancylobacter gelatini TaxID=2919920 RepID=UPI001F4DEA76|nr:hypothetical protein [Ancylobacter gelatini]MCJ8142791.1 hypothetical protein [Ancylobacter gelatini]